MVRLAYAHDLKLRTFGRLLSGDFEEVWYRDVDRLAPDWLVAVLADRTGLAPQKIQQCTLRDYEGRLYRRYRETGVLQWILPLRVYEWKRKGFGLQVCPKCLAEDGGELYFRKRWRVGLYTWCPRHDSLLIDRCPGCGAAISFHRHDLNENSPEPEAKIGYCCECGFDYRHAHTVNSMFYDQSAKADFRRTLLWLEHKGPQIKPRGVRYYNLLHQLCFLMGVQYRNVSLRQFAERALGIPGQNLSSDNGNFELRPIEERHHLAQLGFWLLSDLKMHLTAAWNDGAITQSALIRGFDDRSKQFNQLVRRYSDWRTRDRIVD